MPAILAFTSPQVQRLTGLTARRLEYWDSTGVYQPTYRDDRPRRAYRRIYTFRDVVSLRTLVTLRDKFRVPLDELRKTGQYLMQFMDEPWTKRFWVQDRRVLFHHPGTDLLVDRHGQTSYVDYGAVWAEVEEETENWTRRDPNDVGQITRHRHIQHNQWVVKGTRIPTSAVWSFHKAVYNTPAIIQQYLTLEPEDVEAAIEHERKLQQEAA
jgi:DNA-binding transcriptional MerR regulator